jgi:DNA-binding SARP family transcriptional activator
MFGRDSRESNAARLDGDMPDSWAAYRQGLACIRQADWARALALLAEAETAFSALDDRQGLWRALIGQALLHWREGAAALAIARAMAALRAAEAAGDGFATGCTAWQIANMMLFQGEYRKAADLLDQAQLALDAVGLAPPDGALAAAAQLCAEIVRWQQLCERQQLGQRETEAAIAAVHRDLLTRLNQAAASVRAAPQGTAAIDGLEMQFLLPEPLLGMPPPARPGVSGRLARLWRRLIHTDDVPAAEVLARGPTPDHAPDPLAVEPRTDEPTTPTEPPTDAAPARVAAARESAVAPNRPLALIPDPEPARSALPGGLAIYCFGHFRVYFNDMLIDRWESTRGRTIFKYLVVRRSTAVPKDLLADLFWPESEPDLARRSLHQAIYCLRQTFKRLAPAVQIIKFAHDRYQINSELAIWVDSEVFARAIAQARMCYTAGHTVEAMQSYAVAIDLYSAPFLAEDRYEEWTDEPRRAYQVMHLEALHRLARHHVERGEHSAAILLCQRALAEESCDEEAHQTLMACYMAQGLRHLAVRQFQICANALRIELGLTPSEELEAFYRRVVASG